MKYIDDGDISFSSSDDENVNVKDKSMKRKAPLTPIDDENSHLKRRSRHNLKRYILVSVV